MGSTITKLKFSGVATHKNRMSEVREGALAIGESLLLDRESIAEPRRGQPYESFTAIGTALQSFRRLIAFGGKLISHIATTLRRRDSASSWVAYTGTYTEPDTGFRIRDAQQNSSLYFTTNAGIKKLESLTSTPRAAGVHAPLDGRGSTTGASGFLADSTAVGYRAILYYTDANDVEVPSAPSQRLIVQNSSGGTRNVALTWYIPSGLTTSYYYKIYRSETTEAVSDPPSDELQLVIEGQLTSANISAGNFTATDSTPDSLRGEKLYTSPSIEGPENANDEPPLARDLTSFQGLMLYANVTGKHRFFLNLLGTGTSALRFVSDNVSTTNGSAAMTSVATTTTLRVGMKIKAAAGIPATARILTIDSATTLTMSVNATASGARDVEFQDVVRIGGVEYFGATATVVANKEFQVYTAGTASQNIESTALDFGLVVNGNASATVYVFYDSAFDGFPGQMRIQERAVGGSSFQVSTTAPEAFSPVLPTTDSGAQVSKADRRPNFIVPSKADQPEAVPLGSGIRCGVTAIRRIIALREAVIVLSDVVGILTGTDRSNLRYDELDSTTRLIAPETAVVVNDAVYAYSNQGVVKISPQGVQIASREIERDLVRASRLTGFADSAFAIAYETDRSYILAVPTANSATPTFLWRYHAFTDAWTHALATVSCGIVDPATDELCLGDGTPSLMRRERKNFNRTDYADDELPVNITSSSGLTVNLTSAALLLPLDLLVQGANEVRIAAINSNALTMASVATWSNGAATVYRPIDVVIELMPFHAGDPAQMKQFTEMFLIFREAEFSGLLVEFASDFFPNFDYSVTVGVADPESDWGSQLPMGSDVQNEQVIRLFVPREIQRCHWIRPRLSFSICRESMALAGYAFKVRPMSSRFRGAIAA